MESTKINKQADIHLLHVDDEPGFAELTAQRLEREDDRFRVETATSADDGLAIIEDFSPDCIISDYDMPGTDGLEFLRAVREKYPELPFILYTGQGSEEVASEAISADVTDYLQKTTDSSQYTLLANRIENAVEKYRTRQELRLKNRAMDEAPTGITITDPSQPDNPIVYANEEFTDLTGYDYSDIRGRNCRFLQGEATENEPVATMREAIDKHDSAQVELRNYRRNGSMFWNEVWIDPLRDDTGDVTNFVGFQQDITTRKTREQKLKETTLKLETLVEAFPDVAFIKDVEGNYLEAFASPETEPLLYGGPQAYEDGQHVTDVFDDDEADRVLDTIQRAVDTGTIQSLEYQLDVPSGTRWFEGRVAPIDDTIQGRQAVVWVARDITDRKEREQELAELEAAVETICDNVPLIFYTFDEEGVFTRSEGRALARIGFEPGEAVGQSVFDLYSDRPEIIDHCERALDGERVTATVEIADGIFKAHYAPLVADGEVVGVTGHKFDVTDYKRREQQLQRQNERLDEFVSVVSHDLRNPLNVASARLELAADECDSPHLDGVADALDRMEGLIEDLLTLAREGEPVSDSNPVALANLCQACWETVVTEEASLTVETQSIVKGDSTRLRQLFENLIRNAVDHGGTGVTVTVGDLDDGFYVADDGPGIPEAERSDVFESGYSSSEGGIGFGLAIVKEVAEAHGWDISVTDSADGGARFEITGVEFAAA